MNNERLQFFKDLFLNMLADVQTDHDESNIDVVSGDDLERLTAERENLLELKLQGRKAFFVNKIHEALEKISDGTFGTCDECGEDISGNRLMARPMATRCISCKEEQERAEDHIPYAKKSHTLGKSLTTGANVQVAGEEILGESGFKVRQTKEQLGLSNSISC